MRPYRKNRSLMEMANSTMMAKTVTVLESNTKPIKLPAPTQYTKYKTFNLSRASPIQAPAAMVGMVSRFKRPSPTSRQRDCPNQKLAELPVRPPTNRPRFAAAESRNGAVCAGFRQWLLLVQIPIPIVA
jgi:hypothetical protein